MLEFLEYPGVKGSPVQEIILVGRVTRDQRDFKFRTGSLPGHLIQCVISGRPEHVVNGIRYELAPGSVLWLHNDELQEGRVIESPWSFYTVNFIAPSLG